MSLLARYKKAGGFEQLRKLLENSDSKKQEQLFKVIEEEDPQTANLLKSKILTFEKMLKWDVMIVAEVSTRMSVPVLVLALHSLPKDSFHKLTAAFPKGRVRTIEISQEGMTPRQAELDAARLKLVQKARELEKDKILDIGRIDPELSIAGLKVA